MKALTLIRVTPASSLPWLSLFLLCLSYALVGWSLAAHHVVWFASFLIIALAMVSSWAGSKWAGRILGYVPIVLLIASFISVFVTLTVISSLFLILGFIPMLTTFFAWQEMRFWKFSNTYTFLTLLCSAFLGLGLGELLDLGVLASSRY